MNASRQNYSMSQLVFVPGKLGRLQTLLKVPVCAGDNVAIKGMCVTEMSPLRRNLTLSPVVEYFAFFIPKRHTQENWIQWVMEGYDESQNLATITNNTNHEILCYGQDWTQGETIPLEVVKMYNQVWNRYFRVPSDNTTSLGFGELNENEIPPDIRNVIDGQKYGHTIAHRQTQWNTALQTTTDDDDFKVTVSSNKMDITELAQKQARAATEISRDFFAKADRYKDVLRLAFDTGNVNIDADERPDLLMHKTEFLGGMTVNGTDSDTLGKSVGKSNHAGQVMVPDRYYQEHGDIIVLAAVRYDPIIYEEVHPLYRGGNFSYKYAAGDPKIIMNEPPQTVDLNATLGINNAGLDTGKVPFGQHFRHMPLGYVHQDYRYLDGYPFLGKDDLSTWKNLHYVNANHYDDVFATTQLGHFQIRANFAIGKKSLIPDPMASIYAGTR